MGTKFSELFYWEGTELPYHIPEPNSKPTFDPNFGFEVPRKKREMKITEQEMDASKIPPKFRDYCAHLLPPLYACMEKYSPFHFNCHHEKHAYHHCYREDYILRMKEYERERRLRVRQMKLEGKMPA